MEEAMDLAATVAVEAIRNASDWWDRVNYSKVWQDRMFHSLAALFGIISAVAFIQLIRVQCRVPEYGWTTQKVFHFLNFLVNGVRSVVFVLRRDVQRLKPEILRHILLDMPGLAFFTTYALLVLFWAEIYYQARAVSTEGLRHSFYFINVVVYAIQIGLWLLLWWKPVRVLMVLSKVFFAGVSLFAALGFFVYGGRLLLMLQRVQVQGESRGRRSKIREVRNPPISIGAIYLEEIATKETKHTANHPLSHHIKVFRSFGRSVYRRIKPKVLKVCNHLQKYIEAAEFSVTIRRRV